MLYCNMKQKHRCVSLNRQKRMRGESVTGKESWRIKCVELGKDLSNLRMGRVPYGCARAVCRRCWKRMVCIHGYCLAVVVVLHNVWTVCHGGYAGILRVWRGVRTAGCGGKCVSPPIPSIHSLPQNGVPRSCAYSPPARRS